ncbi:MAG: hypothetical protein WBQ57_11225, partial [Rhodanobacteraceae bacterium]
MKQLALVTVAAARELDEDLAPLATALETQGAKVAIVDWDDPDVAWSRFAAAVLRSTWDYAMRLSEFLDWAARVAEQTLLINPAQIVRWNTDKHYLADIARVGVATVRSTFVEPGDDAIAALDTFLGGARDARSISMGAAADFAEFVVKPAVGAG